MKRFQLSALTPLGPKSGQRQWHDRRDISLETRFITIEYTSHLSEIADALQRVLAHELMRKSPKLQAFLTFIVEETLAGRGDRLKAYSIAIAALGKHTAFDPSTDPIVRVEASRLRRCLHDYYTSDGQNDPLRITMPKGCYRPIFQQVSSTAEDFSPHVAPVRNSKNKPRVDEEDVFQTPPTLPLPDKSVDPDRLYRISHIMLIANVCMILFTLIFGTRMMLDIDRINQRMELFQSFWTKHLTAKVE